MNEQYMTTYELHADYGYLLKAYLDEPLTMGINENKLDNRDYVVDFFMERRSNTLNNMGCFKNNETKNQTREHFLKCYDLIVAEIEQNKAVA